MSVAPQLDTSRLARHLRRFYTRRAVRRVCLSPAGADSPDLRVYRDDPVGFITHVLGKTLTPDQEAIARSFPGRVKVNSGHSVGKTFLAACLVLWWFYTRDPCVVITTAPTERDVIDLLWTEVRLLHGRSRVPLPRHFVGPAAPEMKTHEDHWAKGYTARRGESFQGRHRPSMLFVFDESEGVDPIYWQTTDTMYIPGADHAWLAIGNPLTTSSQSYLEDLAAGPDGAPKWKQFTLSALNHPNVVAGLRGDPVPYPNAVTVSQVDQWVKDWADPVKAADRRPGDFEWRPGSGQYYRPGPQFKARVLGLRPGEGVDTVWSSDAWEQAVTPKYDPVECWMQAHGITIGVDVAVYGDDNSVLHVRTGPLSLHHESHNGWMPDRVAGRIKELSVQWCGWYNSLAVIADRPPLLPSRVRTVIELDGPGAGVISHCQGFGNWVGLKVSERSNACDSEGRPMYPTQRAEMWFSGADKALAGLVDLSRLPQDVRDRLRLQLLTPSYQLLPNGTRDVESKKDVKKRLKRSPDDADGFLVSHFDSADWRPEVLVKNDEAW